MACGMTVAPSMPTARTALSAPLSPGTSPATACRGLGGEATSPARKPTVTTGQHAGDDTLEGLLVPGFCKKQSGGHRGGDERPGHQRKAE